MSSIGRKGRELQVIVWSNCSTGRSAGENRPVSPSVHAVRIAGYTQNDQRRIVVYTPAHVHYDSVGGV